VGLGMGVLSQLLNGGTKMKLVAISHKLQLPIKNSAGDESPKPKFKFFSSTFLKEASKKLHAWEIKTRGSYGHLYTCANHEHCCGIRQLAATRKKFRKR